MTTSGPSPLRVRALRRGTGLPLPDPHFGWGQQETTEFALRQLDYTLQTLTAPNDTAAFFVEPVLGEGGYVPASTEFFAGLRERADRHGILLVVDEVQTGWGRTGRFCGGEHFDARADILITAKGLASGFPLSGIARSSALMEKAARSQGAPTERTPSRARRLSRLST